MDLFLFVRGGYRKLSMLYFCCGDACIVAACFRWLDLDLRVILV
jgi:hypothetical protein